MFQRQDVKGQMRTEGISKMGYYPTPPSMVAKILGRLQMTGPARFFDPCCGEGDALSQVGTVSPSSITYGVEIDGHRAGEAKEKLKHVLHCGYERARVEVASMQLLFLNPPYDAHSGLGGLEMRKELIFLRDLSKQLAPDGVLVFVIPRYTLGPEMVNALFHRFTNLAVYRFDDDEYQAFRQVVVFGYRRKKNLTSAKELSDADRQMKNEMLMYGKDIEQRMPYLEESDGRMWFVPPAANIEVPILFRGYVLDEAELRLDLAQSEVFRIADNMLMSTDVQASLKRPLLPFRRTHMATLISAGALNGAVGFGQHRHMVVGMTRKIVNRDIVRNEDGSETVIDTESYITAVRTIQPDGTILDLQ
ncbi:DUF6094 domain-containing protein [Alicyclobacillus ferrooxydans]|uniref:DUF6094 domain-containing protein n=1 Tax=Alicyclobacillus ferrooxydans TaxID=471514 RepID=UPI0006D5AE9E|nr:DUF6094 domain-containing protein [Alicyclobacillus ferrooxydans]